MAISFERMVAAVVTSVASSAACAATPDTAHEWLAWLVVGAIGLFVAGIVVRTILAMRFPKDYRRWAAQRRESFAANNEHWDRQDEEFKR